ncbi:hypothetical protein HAX54_042768, partial [Datura stramonium]|nr:hypothetical protein [Datura stramonium]
IFSASAITAKDGEFVSAICGQSMRLHTRDAHREMIYLAEGAYSFRVSRGRVSAIALLRRILTEELVEALTRSCKTGYSDQNNGFSRFQLRFNIFEVLELGYRRFL